MLTIRNEQVRLIVEGLFESWMVKHLAEFFAEETSRLNDRAIRACIRASLRKARMHGFATESQWCKYIDLSFVFGARFDEDPDIPWASAILADRRLIDPEMRMEVLFDTAQDQVEMMEIKASTNGETEWAGRTD